MVRDMAPRIQHPENAMRFARSSHRRNLNFGLVWALPFHHLHNSCWVCDTVNKFKSIWQMSHHTKRQSTFCPIMALVAACSTELLLHWALCFQIHPFQGTEYRIVQNMYNKAPQQFTKILKYWSMFHSAKTKGCQETSFQTQTLWTIRFPTWQLP